MPVARRYGTPQVATTPLPRARRSAAETAESLGADVERARGNRAGVIGQVGATVARLGAAKVEEIKERERRRADEIAVLAGENEFVSSAESDLTDALGRSLKNAVGVTAEFDRRIVEKAAGVRQNLSTQKQKDVFDRIVMERRRGWKLALERHEKGQIREMHATELLKGMENDANAAIAAYQDPNGIAKESLTRAVKRVIEHADFVGMGKAARDNQVAALVSAVHVGSVEAHIADGNDQKAKAWFEDASKAGQLLEEHRTALKAKIETASTAGDALRASEDIWKKFGPPSTDDQAPVNIDRMEADARERFKDDPKVLTATIQRLRERKAGVDEGRRDRKEATTGALWGAVAKQATLSQIQAMPEYLRADGDVQERVRAYVVQQAEERANRSYTAGVRADAAEARAERQKERANWAKMWVYSNPETLDAMSENAIISLVPEVGVDHVNRLIEKKRTLVKSEAVVRDAKIDEDLFKSIAHTAGLPVYKPSDNDKPMLGELRNQVETEINARQVATGKALSREEKEVIMKRVVDNRVMIDNWMGDEEKVASLVVNPTDVGRAFIPIERIPKQNVTEWINQIRSLHPSAQRQTDAQILAAYKTRIQRAHAAHVLRLGIDEQRRRLQGQ